MYVSDKLLGSIQPAMSDGAPSVGDAIRVLGVGFFCFGWSADLRGGLFCGSVLGDMTFISTLITPRWLTTSIGPIQ
jgi:hypothetical protein